jgi:hypothetical protein
MQLEKLQPPNVQMAMPIERVIENIDRNSELGFPQITDLPDWRDQMAIAIAGGGPSLEDTVDELRTYRNIMVAGSAHDWLTTHNVWPRWTVISDPDPIMANYLRHPVAGCTYLVASMCDKAVIDALEGHKIVLWHCGDAGGRTADSGPEKKVIIGGGCTVGTRAMVIAMLFGFCDMHLFGFDTCVTDKHHAYDFTDQREEIGTLTPIRIGAEDGREFMMATYHVGQLFDFKQLLKVWAAKLRVTVHGDGALAELMRLAKVRAEEIKAAA